VEDLMSETDLFQKMYIKPGLKFLVVSLPQELELIYQQVPAGVTFTTQLQAGMDIIQVFVKNEQELRARLDELTAFLSKPTGILWISYPKGTSGVITDINRDSIWPIATEYHLSPTRQIAVNEVWSALRFKQMDG
jgi:hypothetical protein